MGCGQTRYGNCGTPIRRVYAWAVLTNTLVMMVAVGMPWRSRVIPSCKLPDEQPPQSPMPVMTRSALRCKSAITSGVGGNEAECFFT